MVQISECRVSSKDCYSHSGNCLELVKCATGVTEAAPAHHGHDNTQSSSQRREDQRDFVAHPAGAVFVDLHARNIGQICNLHPHLLRQNQHSTQHQHEHEAATVPPTSPLCVMQSVKSAVS